MRFLRPGSLRLCMVPVLIGTILLAPFTVLADHDLTCHPPTGPRCGSHEIEMDVHVGKGPGGPDGLTMSTLKFRFSGEERNPLHVTGTFVMPNRGSGQAVTWTAIALAESGGETGATSQCGDGDGDSLIGLQSLTMPFRHNQTGETAFVTFASENEIETSGTYMLVVRGLTDEEFSFEATVRLKGSFGVIPPVE
jgi:hypothetical protein